ncbi:MAG: LPS export ABC transporter ATP-binding protein [Verrucomicrobiota bacterium]|nr:LPS export ABC transporter ATP-binding protein [Verrucomicrobiota bacterium]
MNSEPLLCLQHLAKRYGKRRVIRDLSLSVQRGEVVGLLGPNGAGKTTAFYMTIGWIHPDQGDILFQGKSTLSLSIDERARLGFGYLAQEPSIFRSFTVEENILCILELLPLKKKERQQRLEELLAELRLTSLRKEKASSLSGGERRRLEITRALATRPSLLLLDEPFANIDPLAIAECKALIRLLKGKGIAILITDHNAREILSIIDRGYLLYDGKVFLSGTVSELLSNPEARRTYFGQMNLSRQ